MGKSFKKWTHIGGPAPLFDRLTDTAPELSTEATPLFNYTKEEVIASVMREASNLFNTRCSMPYKKYDAMDPSTLTYGVPDLYGFFDQSYADPSRKDDVIRLCNFMATALSLFEPRLKNIEVTFDTYDQSKQTAHLKINADLKLENAVEPISFPVLVDQIEELGKPRK